MTDERGLMREARVADELVSSADEVAFQDAFLRLVERRTAIYTMGDSTSVPTHVAADLLRSICFVLGIDPEERTVPEQLLQVDLESEFRRRLAEVGRKVEAAEQLWRNVCIAMPLIPNIALRDTLTGIGDFFKHYDYRSMAHEVPCSIDYPLCHPVDSSLSGIDFIAEYLRRMMIEAQFLRFFEIASCERVLAAASPDYIGLLVNVYEPVAINVIGLVLLGEDPARLAIGDGERTAIAARLEPLGNAQRARALQQVATKTCDVLSVSDEDAREYLIAMVSELLPRIEVGLAYRSLDAVFVG
ncbi:MAG: hypothetical protein HGA39_00290 [Coriobacteriia bacterium]|nr:hypothetical protein [Coriobacteriia bacterium]